MALLTLIAWHVWATTAQMAPYLLFGFLMAGVLSVLISPDLIERHLGSGTIGPVLKASLVGVPLPLCSCGVIPVAASLRRHGASKGATTAFLISTPQTGVDSVLVTYGMLGPVFAIFRPIAALVSGVIGGLVVGATEDERTTELTPSSAPPSPATPSCCAKHAKKSKFAEALRYGFVTLPKDIGRPLLAGVLVAGLISAFFPTDSFQAISGHYWISLLAMLGLGIPLYVCATASVPIAAALILKGLSPGAALVFLMTGPASNAASVTTIAKTMGRRTAIIYLLVVAVSALACGLVLDAFIVTPEAVRAHCHPASDPDALAHVSAIALFVLIARSAGARRS